MINVEIKARTSNVRNEDIRKYLAKIKKEFAGTDTQIDTYFNVPNGRLKVRQSNIENALIAYARSNIAGPKTSKYYLSRFNEVTAKEVCDALTVSLGVLV